MYIYYILYILYILYVYIFNTHKYVCVYIYFKWLHSSKKHPQILLWFLKLQMSTQPPSQQPRQRGILLLFSVPQGTDHVSHGMRRGKGMRGWSGTLRQQGGKEPPPLVIGNPEEREGAARTQNEGLLPGSSLPVTHWKLLFFQGPGKRQGRTGERDFASVLCDAGWESGDAACPVSQWSTMRAAPAAPSQDSVSSSTQ